MLGLGLQSPLEQFEIVPLLPFRIGSFDLSFTNSSLMIVFTVISIVLLTQLITVDGKGYLIPSRWQTLMESFYTLILQMLSETVGPKGGQFFPFLFCLFTFILVANLSGLVPYSFTVTSHMVVTLTFALSIWIGKLILGCRYHGLKLLAMLLPKGIPFPMVPFFVLIETVSFVIPVVSLSVRLFANMMSGHILLKVIFGFAWSMMMYGGILFIMHFIPLAVLFLLLGLETAVAIIQAYVFSVLTTIYISDMVHGGHLS